MFQWKQPKAADKSPKIYSLESFPLRPPLPLPKGVTRDELFEWVRTVRVAVHPIRFLSIASKTPSDSFTPLLWWNTPRRTHKVGGLVLNSVPIRTSPPCFCANSHRWNGAWQITSVRSCPRVKATQRVFIDPFKSSGSRTHVDLMYSHFNIEEDTYPFEAGLFDIVLFCEIIEHLLNDPCKVLREIKRVLKDDGALVLTTPNVNRLENVARMIVGANIYDPYSGYGPYGRHNREYNKHELYLMLTYLGFTVEEIFTADDNPNLSANYLDPAKFGSLIEYRKHDLGQYIFVQARKSGEDKGKKPA